MNKNGDYIDSPAFNNKPASLTFSFNVTKRFNYDDVSVREYVFKSHIRKKKSYVIVIS
jgi:hypothetical protein